MRPNWATGTVPTINDDVIVITDQLHGLTPSYPVTIDTAAYAKSLTMNDFDSRAGHKAPEVINKSSLTIAGELNLKCQFEAHQFRGRHDLGWRQGRDSWTRACSPMPAI